MSRTKDTSGAALVFRLALPTIALISFVGVLIEYKAREAGLDRQRIFDAAGMPFQAIPTTTFVIAACLTVAGFVLALRRRGVIGGLLAAVALFFIFLIRLNSYWPD